MEFASRVATTTSGSTDGSASGEFEERLRKLPPSAKLLAKVLERDEPISQGRLAEKSLLPARTVRYGLSRFEEAELVESRYSVDDARKRVYMLIR